MILYDNQTLNVLDGTLRTDTRSSRLNGFCFIFFLLTFQFLSRAATRQLFAHVSVALYHI